MINEVIFAGIGALTINIGTMVRPSSRVAMALTGSDSVNIIAKNNAKESQKKLVKYIVHLFFLSVPF